MPSGTSGVQRTTRCALRDAALGRRPPGRRRRVQVELLEPAFRFDDRSTSATRTPVVIYTAQPWRKVGCPRVRRRARARRGGRGRRAPRRTRAPSRPPTSRSAPASAVLRRLAARPRAPPGAAGARCRRRLVPGHARRRTPSRGSPARLGLPARLPRAAAAPAARDASGRLADRPRLRPGRRRLDRRPAPADAGGPATAAPRRWSPASPGCARGEPRPTSAGCRGGSALPPRLSPRWLAALALASAARADARQRPRGARGGGGGAVGGERRCGRAGRRRAGRRARAPSAIPTAPSPRSSRARSPTPSSSCAMPSPASAGSTSAGAPSTRPATTGARSPAPRCPAAARSRSSMAAAGGGRLHGWSPRPRPQPRLRSTPPGWRPSVQARAADVRASRRRLLSAADAERRALEQRLSDGPLARPAPRRPLLSTATGGTCTGTAGGDHGAGRPWPRPLPTGAHPRRPRRRTRRDGRALARPGDHELAGDLHALSEEHAQRPGSSARRRSRTSPATPPATPRRPPLAAKPTRSPSRSHDNGDGGATRPAGARPRRPRRGRRR